MTAILKVDTIQDTSGNNIINESSDTITIGASGDTTNIIGTLNKDGVAVANTPAFAATLSGDISVDNAETLTKVVFDTEEFDTDNTFSSGRFTPGVVGKYFISGNVNVTNGSNGVVNIAVMRIYKNGSQLTGSDLRVDFRGNPGKGASLSLTAVVSLDADDYIEFYAANLATGGSANIESYGSRIGGYKIIE